MTGRLEESRGDMRRAVTLLQTLGQPSTHGRIVRDLLCYMGIDCDQEENRELQKKYGQYQMLPFQLENGVPTLRISKNA